MLGSIRSIFKGVTVEEKGNEILIQGVDGNTLVRDINKHWKTIKISNNFFNSVSRHRLSFFKFFAPEFTYLLDGVSQYRNRYTSIKMINELKEKMYTNTWLANTQSKDIPGRLNFDRLKNMVFTPEDYQMEYFKNYDIRLNQYGLNGDLVDAATGTGKAQPVDTPVKVPSGWKAIGELKVGDLVLTQDGTYTEVTGIYPQGELETFKLTFEDGRSTNSCKEHLWQVNVNGLDQVVNTGTLIDTLESKEIYIPLTEGAIEGKDNSGSNTKFYNGSRLARRAILEDLRQKVGLCIGEDNKEHLEASQLDTAKSYQMLIRSLGYISEITSGPNGYLVSLVESDKGLRLTNIEPNGKHQCVCISVKHESRLYVTNDYIVTHNTFITTAIAEMLESDLVVVICPKETLDLVWVPSIDEMYKKEQTIWTSTKIKDYNGERFVICHYNALDKLLDMLKGDPSIYRNKKITTILDESHNMNDIRSQRTQHYLELVKLLGSKNNLLASGTALKAMGVEMIPMLRVIDPLFTEAVEKRFRGMYGQAAAKGLDIIKFRLGLVSFKIEKKVLELAPPIVHGHPIKIPNGKDYTLPAIKLVMEEYIKQRLTYYESRRKDDELFWAEVLRIHQSALKSSKEKDLFKEYLRCVNVIKRNPGALMTLSEEIMFTNRYEKNNIEPTLPREYIKQFRDVKSIIKYVQLKIQGECLGNVLGRKRIECHVDMAPFVDWVGITESTTKKTISFTSFVEALEASTKHLMKIGLKPATVYGSTKAEMVNTVSRFEKDKSLNPLLATYASLSTGVRLTMADTIILLNSPFRQYILEQAIARAWRKGQDSQVVIYKVTLDTGDIPNISTRSDDILKWSAEQVSAMLGIQNTYDVTEVVGNENFKFDMPIKDVPDEEQLFVDSINHLMHGYDIEYSLEDFKIANNEPKVNIPSYLR